MYFGGFTSYNLEQVHMMSQHISNVMRGQVITNILCKTLWGDLLVAMTLLIIDDVHLVISMVIRYI